MTDDDVRLTTHSARQLCWPLVTAQFKKLNTISPHHLWR